ncbi:MULTISPECIES: caspase family protein [unclassified Massilia]|uniref:caspase family protein n=1 Tax=unclassified Massilia TaxID=2609279 RepID=UPI00177F2238|nr:MULTISPECIES: caspase family protein [unclassified Massilia]MBD8530010.1 caspase family protein [Massilia sp. CFBP 13647]MBD8673928.1 caspase family protein [Massilia sp. CFBP 13721]
MPAPFKRISLEQFSALLDRFPFSRAIDAVHMHHTWRPDHRQFAGHDSIVGMWKFHTEHNGWSDIAQHITIDPEGGIWLGRDWNMPPASARGHNGDHRAGPFMFEMIGDFDVGRDRFEGAQRATAIAVVALVQQCFDLAPDSLKFHNMLSGKTCPGSSIDYAQVLEEVGRERRALARRNRALPDTAPPFHRDFQETGFDIAAMFDAPRGERCVMTAFEADADACTHHYHDGAAGDPHAGRGSVAGSVAAPAAVRAQQLDLRPHLINLSMGELSGGGAWTTTRADVAAMFDEHLPRALERARAAGKPLRLMFQAHGGLNDEATGLAIARKSVAWWLENGIYPVYFAWETGLFESIGQLLRRAVSGKRDFADFTSDPLIQETVRLLGAPKIWGVMKQNAQAASWPDTLGSARQVHPERQGGAHLVAQQLAAFCRRHGQDVELHAVGHSAGAIFHAWFIPCALQLGVPRFRSLHLMAPALRVDLFKEKLAPLLGQQAGIGDLTVYTMRDELEARDDCARIYRKSLLYLIFHALEPQRKTPILGLEENLRADSDLSRLFGLSGGAGRAGVIWSRTQAVKGASASNATSHGGFDDDAATMGSIARRILGRQDHEAIVEYTPAGDAARGAQWGPAVPDTSGPIMVSMAQHGRRDDDIRSGAEQGTRRALCVGINAYAERPLAGCLADVESWSRVLGEAGFAVARLLDAEATRANIVARLESMIAASRKGDVIVFQYAGHGTRLPDQNADEMDALDEALVPYDYETGAFLLDDDLGQIYARLPDGVNLSCFMDCCHSGDNARLLFAEGDERPRFLPPSAAMIDAHRRYREKTSGDGKRAFAAGLEAKPTFEVSFAACSPTESAWESQGQGAFTVKATAILAQGFDGLSNGQFIERVRADFGDDARQHVQLDSSHRGAPKRLLLQPLADAPVTEASRVDTDVGAEVGAEVGADAGTSVGQLVELLQRVEQLLQQAQPQLSRVKGWGRPNGGLQVPPPQSLQSSGEQNR